MSESAVTATIGTRTMTGTRYSGGWDAVPLHGIHMSEGATSLLGKGSDMHKKNNNSVINSDRFNPPYLSVSFL